MFIISAIGNNGGEKTHGLDVDTSMFRVSNSFLVGAVIVCGILAALYTVFW
jgi:SSS family solute:Na+ symporter